MSKMAAIHIAVCQRLAQGNYLGHVRFTDRMGMAPAQNPPADVTFFRYNLTTMMIFLLDVANCLKADSPSLTFDWSKLDASKCVEMDIRTLEAIIATVTQ
jgi:hypothetical protein